MVDSINESKPWRTFCAIELPAAVSVAALAHSKRLREQFPDSPASWNRDGKFHLTIKFIGETPQDKVERISLAAQRATANLSAFRLSIRSTGVFPKKGPPKVLWLGADDPTGQLLALHAQLEQESAIEGFAKEARAFHPHLTLARVRDRTGARELAAAHEQLGFAAVEFFVSELLVIRSELSSAGSKYTSISRHELKS